MNKLWLIPKIITAEQAESRRKHLRSFWSVETQLTQKILIACLHHLERLSPRRKQNPNRYALFFGKMARKGFTAKQIAKIWKDKS